MLRVLTSVLHRVLRPTRGGRRGTVLLLALGVLGILSIAAISYVTIIRLDRASAEAGSRRASYQQQPDAVVEHIGAVLTADLFGEKIVTDDVPAEYWPRMFEDGDTRDLPSTDLLRNSFNTNDPDNLQPSSNAILPAIKNSENTPELQQRRAAYPDDAWLASYDPLWNPATGNPQSTRRWPQITNLRASYTWKTLPNSGQWVRDNGRFVDLGQWFIQASYLSPMQGFPNPGVQLMKWTGSDGVTIDGQLGPDKGVDQDVFQYQVNLMARYTAPTDSSSAPNGSVDPLTPRDERQWVDTDGDLRPDARWQQLDVLGNLFGLNWVVAARIVDASALVNVNTALEFGAEQDFTGERQADGRTPADVDLYRLLVGAGDLPASNAYSRRVRTTAVGNAFSEWINTDLDMQGILADAKNIYGTSGTYFDALQNTRPWTFNERTRRIDREAFYHYFAASPQKTSTARGTAIPIRDLIDLAAFYGSNNDNMVSRTEQRFDGPSVNGFLPDGSPTGDFGPMRSRERPEDIRRFATAPETANGQRPTSQQIKESRRRMVTTVSGDAPFMPIPVLNTGPNSAFKGRVAADPRIPLDTPLSDDGVRRAFEAFVWALEPMATNLPLNRGMKELSLFNIGDSRYHYGGGIGGPAKYFREWQRAYPVPTTAVNPQISTTDADASFATVTAASLAANLKDALDTDGKPSVVRVFAQAFAPSGAAPLTAGTRHATTFTKPVILTSEFVHGAIDPQNLKAIGAPVAGPTTSDPTKGGITVVGLERQPFLSEVTTIAIYSDSRLDRVDGAEFLGGNGNHVAGDTTDEELGSAIVIELINPWSTPIMLDGYSVVIPETENQIGSNPFVVSFPNSFLINPGASARFYWMLETEFGVWFDVRDAILSRPLFAGALELTGDAVSPLPSLAGLRIPFRNLLDVEERRPVLLVYDRRTIDLPPHPGYVVDRMSPDVREPPSSDDAFPRGLPAGGFDFAFDSATPPDNVPPGLTFDEYYGPGKLGYLEAGGPPAFNNRNRVMNKEVTGRVMITSSLSRSGVNVRSAAATSSGGFPLTILEVPNANHMVHRRDAHAWIYPFTPSAVNPEPVTSKAIPADIINGATAGPINFPADHSSIGATVKFADLPENMDRINAATVSALQLHVPMANTGPTGARLNALSELHMLSCYASTCRTRDTQAPRDWEIELADLQNWQTVGEKMGLSLIRDFDLMQSWDPAAPGTVYPMGPLNPYVGVLDPSRFIPGSPEMIGVGPQFPDTMRIPLALRVCDCFWPASLNTTLAQGRININTAPEQVLQCLPLVDPQFPVGAGGEPLPAGRDRLDALTAYRDPAQQLALTNQIALTGLRQQIPGAPLSQGFSSTGELAILDIWDGANPGQIASGASRWLQLADPSSLAASDGAPLEMVTDYVDPSYNPVDDPEERLALYRAVSNIVTTRSDVFLAWFVIRGYEPAVIERIPINGSSVQERLNAMDDETFRPAYESRWLVVFDRSNVRRPTDRPNVLLQVELPRATP